jgi:hypothetical protein
MVEQFRSSALGSRSTASRVEHRVSQSPATRAFTSTDRLPGHELLTVIGLPTERMPEIRLDCPRVGAGRQDPTQIYASIQSRTVSGGEVLTVDGGGGEAFCKGPTVDGRLCPGSAATSFAMTARNFCSFAGSNFSASLSAFPRNR